MNAFPTGIPFDRATIIVMAAVALLAMAGSALLVAQECTFRASAPILSQARRTQATVTAGVRSAGSGHQPPQNFIDTFIFRELQRLGVQPAPASTGFEFVRRIYLDLTGRIPTPDQIRDFNASGDRNLLVQRLLDSDEFNDKWTTWVGDWLQNTRITVYGSPVATRNQFYRWIRAEVRERRSMREVAFEVLTGGMESAAAQTGGFLAAAEVTTGPKEDGWDNMLAKSATVFLGLGHYDCLLCHNGYGHLDGVSLWASRTTRIEAQRMAAFFTNTFSYPGLEITEPTGLQYYQTAGYSMNTSFGNRPNRVPATEGLVLPAVYRDGGKPPDGEANVRVWRRFFADRLIADPMFARNLANRLWKQMFGLALAEPVDGLDPDRLDPANPPRPPWRLQASHPELLEALAQHLRDTDYDLRDFLALLAGSSAYQLSSHGPSSLDDVDAALQARHLPRRLDAEEVHDAIQAVTGLRANYRIEGMENDPPVRWAMQLPDTSEPSRDPEAKAFLDAFYRGDRAEARRSASASLLQSFKLMNDPFVLRRIDASVSPVLARFNAIPDPENRIREAFLTFLSREPSAAELQAAGSAPSVEDLAWALINMTEFLYCP